MKYSLILLALCLLLSGCGKQPQESPAAPAEISTEASSVPAETEPSTEAPAPETEETHPETTEASLPLSYDAYRVIYNIQLEDMEEAAEFQGIGPEGDLLWTYKTGTYDQAQLPRITPIGAYEDRYYFVEDGCVTALDITTGEVLFKNTEFSGSPAPGAFLLDEYGFLYLAGFDGPDFFAMDPQGHTVKRIPSLSDTYLGPYEIRLENNQLVVYMERDNQGNSGSFPCPIDRDWLPQAQG